MSFRQTTKRAFLELFPIFFWTFVGAVTIFFVAGAWIGGL